MRNKLLLVLILLLVSCKTTEKKAKEYAYNNKDKLAEWCADCFPVKELEVIKGDTIVDTVLTETIDTLYKIEVDCPDGSIIHADCPPNKTVYKTINTKTTDTIKVRDTAKETVLSNDLNNRSDEVNKMKEKANKLQKYLFASFLIIVVLVLLKLR